MKKFKAKNKTHARKTAGEVARYYFAYRSFMGHKPTQAMMGRKFGYSQQQIGVYLRYARELGFIHEGE